MEVALDESIGMQVLAALAERPEWPAGNLPECATPERIEVLDRFGFVEICPAGVLTKWYSVTRNPRPGAAGNLRAILSSDSSFRLRLTERGREDIRRIPELLALR